MQLLQAIRLSARPVRASVGSLRDKPVEEKHAPQ